MPRALAETSNPQVRAGAPRASAVLIGMVGPPPTTGPAYRSDTSSEEVGEATLARSARSGLASATPGPGHQARIPNGILCSWSSSQINLGHERAAGCHRLCRRRSSGHWRVRRPGHGQADHRSGNRSPDPASWPPPRRHRAPRETVFAAAAAPYTDRQPRAMQEKVEILERAGQMVLAVHRTALGSGLTAVTVETVTLDPPTGWTSGRCAGRCLT